MRIVAAALVAGLSLASSIANAQAPATPAPATPAPAAPAPVPEAMPFDIPYGTPINLDTAHKAIMAAAAEAKKHNWKMAITVVDPSGNLLAHATMDGTQYGSIEVAQSKARTAALFRRPTLLLQNAVNTGGSPATLAVVGLSRGVATEGGFPIIIDGKVIGAIGASGGLSVQDATAAKAGLAAIGAQ